MPSSASKSRKIPSKLSAGGRAVIRGLQARPDLNHRLVSCVHEAGDRWKCILLPVGGTKEVLGIKPENLQPAPPSAFLLKIPAKNEGGETKKELVVPLACSIGRDGYGNLGVRLMYSEFLGHEALIPVYQRVYGSEDEVPDKSELHGLVDEMFSIVTSPYQGALARNECVVVRSKHEELFDSLIQYECLADTGKRVVVGMHRDPRVCKILFPYDME